MSTRPSRPDTFPLSTATPGQPVRIIAHDADKGLSRRLRDLGLPVGVDIEIVHGSGRGRMVIAHGHTRLALDSKVSRSIHVTPAVPGSSRISEPLLEPTRIEVT